MAGIAIICPRQNLNRREEQKTARVDNETRETKLEEKQKWRNCIKEG